MTDMGSNPFSTVWKPLECTPLFLFNLFDQQEKIPDSVDEEEESKHINLESNN